MASGEKWRSVELFAFIGADEHGSGEVGIKQGIAPAGYIPLVAVDEHKMRQFCLDEESQARLWGKKIRLCRFTLAEVIWETSSGKDQ